MNVLVINAGSSSLKYQLFNMDNKAVLAKGLCERIGIDGRLTHTNPNKEEKYKADVPMKDHADAIRAVINILIDKDIVHGQIGVFHRCTRSFSLYSKRLSKNRR